MPIERPNAGGDIPLDDDSLARIGLAVVYEGNAKSVAGLALRALRSWDLDRWKRLEREPFGAIMRKLRISVNELDDGELSARFADLESAISEHHDIRHMIVHVAWGFGGDGFIGYDYGRAREVTAGDIEDAVRGCAEIRRAASWFTMRVANLVEEGVLPERTESVGAKIKTEKGSVRL